MRLNLIRVALAAAVLLFGISIYKAGWREGYTDFEVYYRASARLQAGEWTQLYSPADGRSMLRYSPMTFPLLWPWAWLEPRASLIAWVITMFGCFAAGFALLRRSLASFTPHADAITGVSFLLCWRFIFDSLRIGQVSGLMFLGLSMGLFGILMRKPWMASGGLLIPTGLKIGLGILYPQALLARDRPFAKRVLVALAGLSVLLWLLVLVLCGGIDSFLVTMESWKTVLLTVVETHSKDYQDTAHYGSQSLNSAFLRLAQSGWITDGLAHAAWIVSVIALSAGYLSLLVLRMRKDSQGQLLLYAIGVMVYLLVMPFTFKYAMALLPIPIAALFLHPRSRSSQVAIAVGACTLFLPGKDVIGSDLFFALNRASFPALGMSVIFAALLYNYWGHSRA